MTKKLQIEIRTSPHAHANEDVVRIMRNVVGATLPIAAYAVWQYGLSALGLIVTVTLACLLTERLVNRLSDQPSTLGDWSATITGLLLALTLPPGFPLWMGALAGFIAIALGKALFGGLGMNPFNPALVGRAFVQAAFPVAITTWTPALFHDRFSSFIPSSMAAPLMRAPETSEWIKGLHIDGFTGATPLAMMKFEKVATPVGDMIMGGPSGSTGEIALVILVCGLYLAFRGMLDWRIPVAILAGAALTSAGYQLIEPTAPGPLFTLFSGGLMLGAWFMATDMVGSPLTPKGVVVYGLLIGIVTVVIRLFGGLSEGVMYAILLGNAATPLIDQLTQPKVFGTVSGRKQA